MEPIHAEASSIASLPVEIVIKVLEYLPATEQRRCKCVCRMWCRVLTDRDECWRRRCARDFSETYEHAHSRCHPPLTWRQLHRSLHLWTKLDVAKETWTKILDTSYAISISVVYLHKDNLVLQIYNPKSFKEVYYLDKYTHETKQNIVLHKESAYDRDSYVNVEVDSGILKIRKLDYDNGKPFSCETQPDATIDNVHDYVVISRDVYYTVCNGTDLNKIFVCKRSDNYNSSTQFITAPLPIKGLSYYHGCLHVWVENNRVFKVVENKLVHVQHEHNVFMPLIYGFQLIDHSELYCYWHLEPSRYSHPHGKNIYFHYNNLIFALDIHEGVLSIFKKAVVSNEPLFNGYSSEPMDIEAAELVKVYDLSNAMLRGLTDLLDFTSIDVVEKENGHTVYVATESKVLALDLDH